MWWIVYKQLKIVSMGLDMYLNRKLWTGDYNVTITNPENSIEITTPKIEVVQFEVAYWRKFNALHNWFVKNIQEGVDDCKDYYVSKDNLEKLLDVLKRVEADHSLASSLFPATPGFFFDTTDYDEWYFENVVNTIKIIEKELETEFKGTSLYYSSSW